MKYKSVKQKNTKISQIVMNEEGEASIHFFASSTLIVK